MRLKTTIEEYVSDLPIIDTHEHLLRESEFLASGFDILRDLFDHYMLK